MPAIVSKTYTCDFDVIPATGAPYWPSIACGTRVRVKPDIRKINRNKYFYSRIQTKLSTQKRYSRY